MNPAASAIAIYPATSPHDYHLAQALFIAYAEHLGINFDFQNFEHELTQLPEMYGPPRGALMLANVDGHLAGGVGLRDLGDGYSEMKRLFVYPQFQGLGLGHQLVEQVLHQARVLGYQAIRLDTLPRLASAYRLYQRFGFYEIGPYCHNPYPDAIFMELCL